MKTKVIVAQQYITKNHVCGWMVGITGESKPRMFLKSAKKAMGYMFILKIQTGLQISDNCLQRLSFAYKQEKEWQKQKAFLDEMENIANKPLDEEYERQQKEMQQQKAQQPEKKQRKSTKRSKKNNQVSAQ